jgi:hypothetical protein
VQDDLAPKLEKMAALGLLNIGKVIEAHIINVSIKYANASCRT